MSIRYALFQNHLTSDPNDYAAQVRTTESVGLNELVARMIEHGSTANEATIQERLEKWCEEECKFAPLEWILERMSPADREEWKQKYRFGGITRKSL